MGFYEEMIEIIKRCPLDRQTLLFSATMPEDVERISRRHMRAPLKLNLSQDFVGVHEITHAYYMVSGMGRPRDLLRVLEVERPDSAIIFCNTREETGLVAEYLRSQGLDAEAISSDLTQAERERVMGRTKAKRLKYLVATDVAARGIDISDLAWVVNYDTSDSPEVYVHRTGRTGRAGKAGVAVSLVSGLDIGNFKYMQTVTKIKVAERKIPSEADLVARIGERLRIKIEHDLRHMPDKEKAWRVDRLLPMVEDFVKSDGGLRDLAALCAAYLQEHRPETTLSEQEAEQAAHEAEPGPAARRDDGGGRRGGGGGRGGRRRGGGGRGGGRRRGGRR
jgi:ATP-dependent RNA helicase DeaD